MPGWIRGVLAACLIASGSAYFAVTPGMPVTPVYAATCNGLPDGFGYTCAADNTGSIVAGTTLVTGTGGPGTDDSVGTVVLPFTFRFYGADYTQAVVSTNGNLRFVSALSGDPTNQALPVATLDSVIFAYWDDLIPTEGAFGTYTSTSGVAPNRVFNIEWRTSILASDTDVTFEIRLFETTNVIEVHYGTSGGANGLTATAGIQGGTGTSNKFIQFSSDSQVLVPGLKITYTPPAPTPTSTATATSTVTPTATVTATSPSTSTPTSTVTQVPTATSTGVVPPTATATSTSQVPPPTATVTSTLPPTATQLPTSTPTPTQVPPTPIPPTPGPSDDGGDPNGRKDKEHDNLKNTEEGKLNKDRTNKSGHYEWAVEGNVMEVLCDKSQPSMLGGPYPSADGYVSIVIANMDGFVRLRLIKGADKSCNSIRVGDYVQADGYKQHENLYDIDGVDIKRGGRKVT